MPNNIFIGIGGTGSRCADAAMHMSYSGLIQRQNKNKIIVVDQDQENGNANDTIGRLRKRRNLADFLAMESKNDTGHARNPLGPEIAIDEQVRVPVDESLERAAGSQGFGGVNNNVYKLYKSFYEQKERTTNPIEGFYANPYIGNAVLSLSYINEKQDENGFWNNIISACTSTDGKETRLLLAGSIFGGTGASVLPALAEKIRFAARKQGHTNIKVGAVLMLPYFNTSEITSFGPMSDQQVGLALSHYANNLCGRENTVFDRIYLIGLDKKYQFNDNGSAGGSTQNNDAMFPELLAGLAAAHFYEEDSRAFQDRKNFLRVAGRQHPDKVTWSDLPKMPNREQDLDVERRIKHYATKSLAYIAAFEQYFATREIYDYMINKHSWFHFLFNQYDFDGIKAYADLYGTCCQENLEWLNQVFSHSKDLKIDTFTGLHKAISIRIPAEKQMQDEHIPGIGRLSNVKLLFKDVSFGVNLHHIVKKVVTPLVNAEHRDKKYHPVYKGLTGLIELIDIACSSRIKQ